MQGFSIARRDGHPDQTRSPRTHTRTHTHTHTLHRIVHPKVTARRSLCRTGFQSGCCGRRVCPISPSGAQPGLLIKVSILEATHRESVCSVVVAHVGTAAESEAAGVSAKNRTAPVVSAGTDKAERTIA